MVDNEQPETKPVDEELVWWQKEQQQEQYDNFYRDAARDFTAVLLEVAAKSGSDVETLIGCADIGAFVAVRLMAVFGWKRPE